MKARMVPFIWTGVALVIAPVIALFVKWSDVVCWTNEYSGLASWVQAIGSILAIGAAAGVVVLQHELSKRHAKKEGIDAMRRKLSMILAFVSSAGEDITSIEEQFSDEEDVAGFRESPLDFCGQYINFGADLDLLPLNELADEGFVTILLRIKRVCREIRSSMKRIPGMPDELGELGMELQSLNMLLDSFRLLEISLKERFEQLLATKTG